MLRVAQILLDIRMQIQQTHNLRYSGSAASHHSCYICFSHSILQERLILRGQLQRVLPFIMLTLYLDTAGRDNASLIRLNRCSSNKNTYTMAVISQMDRDPVPRYRNGALRCGIGESFHNLAHRKVVNK